MQVNYVTWGEVTKETVSAMLQKRARLSGNKKLTEEYLTKIGYKTFDELAEALINGKVEHGKLPFMTPLFKLHPPTKGYKGKTKKTFQQAAKQVTAAKQSTN